MTFGRTTRGGTMADLIDPEMVSGEIIAKRTARDIRARTIARRGIPWWLLALPAGASAVSGVWPYAAIASGVLLFVVAGWLMYSINRRFDALVQLTGDAGTSD
jgi:hypothetical protein